jgi:dTDP-4-amino-4,6-dideoxygalactose transaminase
MNIPFNDLKRQFVMFENEYKEAATKVLESGWYVLGNEVREFEEEFAEYIGVKHCVGLASGLDALTLAFDALGIGKGDEVIVAANAYIACVMGITKNGATPVFIEPDEFYNIDASRIDENITGKTKAILAVHLYGQSCDMNAVMSIADAHDLFIIEDCAQSHGAKWNDQNVGSFGDIACFSFYPTKGCGAFGDGGAIVTNDDNVAEYIKMMRNYGSNEKYHFQKVGVNSRLDEIQAAMLRVKLRHLDMLNEGRRAVSEKYLNSINNELISLPKIYKNANSVWHLFVIKCKRREHLSAYLNDNGIHTDIHYPIPPFLNDAYSSLNISVENYKKTVELSETILSMPLFVGMTDDEIDYVIKTINAFEI